MKVVRTLALAVGLLLTGITLLLLAVPGVAASVPIGGAVDALGGDYVFVAMFGLIAVVLVLAAMAWRGVDGLDQTTPPAPEDVQSVPLLGGGFDEVIDGPVGIRERFFSDRPAAIRDRLRGAAVTAEMQATGCSRAQAVRRVHSGTWTDDAEAAAFLSDENGPSPPPAARVGAALRGKAWYQRGARRAADAAVRRSGSVSDR